MLKDLSTSLSLRDLDKDLTKTKNGQTSYKLGLNETEKRTKLGRTVSKLES